MKREILFRGKRTDNGEWVEGYYVYNGQVNALTEEIYEAHQIYRAYDRYSIDPTTVGQYTGLRDKNGVKIFEGDVIRMKIEDAIEEDGFFWWKAEVKEVRGCLVLCPVDFDYSKTPLDEYELLFDYLHTIEVTGNIHDE